MTTHPDAPLLAVLGALVFGGLALALGTALGTALGRGRKERR